MSNVVQCPACETQLDLKTRDRLGKRVRCPRCKEVFTAKLASGAKQPRGKSSPSPRRRQQTEAAPPRRNQSSSPPPRRAKKPASARKRKSKKRNIPIIPLAIGGTVMALLVGGSLWLMSGGDDTPDGSASDNSFSTTATADNVGNATKATAASVPSEPVSEAEALEFATTLEKAVKAGNVSDFSRMLNYKGIVTKAIAEVPTPERFKRDFLAGLLRTSNQLATQIIQQANNGGSYTFVNQQSSDRKQQVLFRLVVETGFNYHLFDLEKRSGSVLVSDLFVAATGEYVSESVRRVFIPLATSSNRSILDRMLGRDQLLAKHWPTVEKLTAAFQAGQYQVGMQHVQKLPPELQTEPFILIQRISCAGKSQNMDEYGKSLGVFRDAHPNSMAADIMAIDFFLLRRRYSESLQAVNRLDKFVKGDPYLQIVRGNVCLASRDFSSAAQYYLPLLKDDGLGKQATTAYLDAVIGMEDHRGTLETLIRLEKEYGMNFPPDLSNVDGFQAFGRSPEHEEFKRR